MHPSLLPKFRGPSPVLSAILADERTTGVTIMEVAEQMDAGPIVAQARVEVAPEDWPPKGSVFLDLLATEGGNLLAEVMRPWIEGEIKPVVQDESQATYTKKFVDMDARVNLSGDPWKNFLTIQAFDAKAFDLSQRAYFISDKGKRIIITDATYKDGVLEILKVIPEGKKEISYKEFVRNGAK